jgi:DNA-binding MurR/RpiR family transcriptional regulator
MYKGILANDLCPYAVLREHLTERFSEKLPPQYHYTRLQHTTQEKGESVEEFADRYRRLCQKTIRIVNDEATQRVTEAERRLVAAYIRRLLRK